MNNKVVVLDTNILLSLYRKAPDESAFILKCLNAVRPDVWLPAQVIGEYYKHYKEVRDQQFNKYKNMPKNLSEKLNDFKGSLSRKISEYHKLGFADLLELEEDINSNIENIRTQMADYVKRHKVSEQLNKLLLERDIALEYIKSLQNHQKGEVFTKQDLLSYIREGELRYKYKISPGFMDDPQNNKKSTKEGLDIFGDYFIWEQIIKYSIDNRKDIVFVTEDKKPDWFDDKTGLPNKDLEKEFAERTDNQIKILRLNKFITKVTEANAITPENEYHTFLSVLAGEYFDLLMDSPLHDMICGQFEAELQKRELRFSDGGSPADDVVIWSHEDITAIECEIEYEPGTHMAQYNYSLAFQTHASGSDVDNAGMPVTFNIFTQVNLSLKRELTFNNQQIDLTNKNIDYQKVCILDLDIMFSPSLTNYDFDDSCITDEKY